MNISNRNNNEIIARVPTRIRPALGILLEAKYYAEQTSGDSWEFAVELDQLTALGLNLNDFRWLVRKGLVMHQREVTLEGDNSRSFQPTGDLKFSKSTCFILSKAGIEIASQSALHKTAVLSPDSILTAVEENGGIINGDFSINENDPKGETVVPIWDLEKRELSFDGLIVKQFKWTAANQETILVAFQEESWRYRIDDPLPPHPNLSSKRRLSDTIKCLNRKQVNQLIHFSGDGTGEGITWDLVERNGFSKK